jgi:hypothetical protein
MRLPVVGASVALFLVTGLSCHGRGPSTRVMIYNISMSAVEIEGHGIEVTHSSAAYAAHSVVDTLDVKRGTVVARLVITSLVEAADANDYDAAINVHEDVPGVLYSKEYDPYIDAVVIAP